MAGLTLQRVPATALGMPRGEDQARQVRLGLGAARLHPQNMVYGARDEEHNEALVPERDPRRPQAVMSAASG